MNKKRLCLLFGATITALAPVALIGQATVVGTYKITPRKKANLQSWKCSVKSLEKEFDKLKKTTIKHKERYESLPLIGMQRTAKTRSKGQRKIFRKQLDKIDKILEKMKISKRNEAIINLQHRIYALKKRMGAKK